MGAELVCGSGLLLVSRAFLTGQVIYLGTWIGVLEGCCSCKGSAWPTRSRRPPPRSSRRVAILGSILSSAYTGPVSGTLAMHLAAGSAGVALLGALVVSIWLPGKAPSQPSSGAGKTSA